jgi:hypothetical protein
VKILIPNLPFVHFRNIAGCLQTLESKVDIQIFSWNPDQKPIIDVFDEVAPDLVFLHENQLGRAFDVLCKELDFNYVLVGSQHPANVAKKPCAVITSKQFEENFKNQENIISLPPAAKVTEIHAARKIKMLESEVLLITGVLPNTEAIMDSMRSLCRSYRTKIIGDIQVPLPHYLGSVNMFERANFIKSAKVFVDFGSYEYLDAAYLKTAPLFGQTPLPTFETVKTFSDIPTLMEGVDSLLSDSEGSKKYVEDLHEDVIHRHTYYHRCAQVFKEIGLTDISDALLSFLKGLLK